ncbi:hypothetical protein F383_16063 [Gossypium arboreum]|uniref:Uncharacterized protein n=1 Tax=Gossypium arboreum TaxID=29729 RepID=A0A0B0PUA9_GOSAR|nr:hypothetical protein F383_16063 [Gossypium arboreum]
MPYTIYTKLQKYQQVVDSVMMVPDYP